jgi:hypothetical protein
MDLRNNLILVERYLPKSLRRPYRHDWIRRYSALARHDGEQAAAKKGLYEALVWARRERAVGRQTLDEPTLESIFNFRAQAEAVAAWKSAHNVRRVVLADFSKNIYATYVACRSASLETIALADDRPAFDGLSYRNLPVVTTAELKHLSPDGIVLSSTNPAQVAARAAQLKQSFDGPVLTLWATQFMEQPAGEPKPTPAQPKVSKPAKAPGARAA